MEAIDFAFMNDLETESPKTQKNKMSKFGVRYSQSHPSIYLEYLLYFLAIIMLWWVKDHFFFWDTVSVCRKTYGLYYFQHYCEVVLLPDDFDSGHIQFLDFTYVTMEDFGISLPISHWAMLPFINAHDCIFTVRFANVFEKSDYFSLVC